MTPDPDHQSNIDERPADSAASAAPSPLGARLSDLPRQYLKVLTKPAASTFAQELDKSSWVLVCLQLLALLVISLVYTILALAHQSESLQPLGTPLGAVLDALSTTLSYYLVVMGLTWVLARALGGRGTLLAQSYTTLLILVPLVLLGSLLTLPFAALLPQHLFLPAGVVFGIATVVFVDIARVVFAITVFVFVIIAVIYVIHLLVYATMAVHHLSGGKAFAAVFFSLLIWVLGSAFLRPLVSFPGQGRPLPSSSPGAFTLSGPQDIIAGPGGNLWFTNFFSHGIGRITLEGQITEFAVDADFEGITAGSDGSLWFTDFWTHKIGRITPQGQITRFAVTATVTADNTEMTAGPDGTLWFIDSANNSIGRITPHGSITEFAIPTKDSSPNQITPGPDGAIWFSEGVGKIGRITTNGTITEFAIPTRDSTPDEIIAGPDRAIWFVDDASNSIGHITTKGSITEFALSTKDLSLVKLIAGSDGTIWFLEVGQGIWKLGRITTNGRISQFAFTAGDLDGITAGPDGALWFTEGTSNRIDRITAQGSVTEFAIPTPKSFPLGITAGPDGALWFTENASEKIGRITPQGRITEFAFPIQVW